jgi:CubicO group peptidase (beta-lactamase class C family)
MAEETQPEAPDMDRRSFLRASGATAAAGAAATFLPNQAASASGRPHRGPLLTDDLLRAFDDDVRTAFETFGMVGASVAVFEGDKIVYNGGFGTRDLRTRQPVTTRTRFRIASNTKSMTSFLLARYVDDGLARWNARAVDLWPEFRAPNRRLTSSLRLADLLGMGTGIAESATIEFFLSGGEDSAIDVLHSIPYLPVIAPPRTTYFYNNSLVSAAPFLVMLANGTRPAVLAEHYAAEVRRLVFGPIGMRDSAVASDPRPLTSDFATGYQIDLFGDYRRVPFVSIDGQGPAGSAMSSSTDMARYLITQMQLGVTPDGRRIASARNVERTHRPGIRVPPDATNALPSVLLPDTTAMHYCLGWFDQRFKDGRQLLWHAGGIDGFGSFMGFFPRERVGFVFLTNLEPGNAGTFNFSIESSLLSRLFGLNDGLPALLASFVPIVAETRAQLARRTRPVDRAAVEPYLGLYSEGFELRLDPDGNLRLLHDIRSFPLLALVDGGYVIVAGPDVVAMKTVTLATSGVLRRMTIDGFDPVRWLTGD